MLLGVEDEESAQKVKEYLEKTTDVHVEEVNANA
jgi:hypothetical protein